MKKEPKPKIVKLQYKTYLVVIENSVGSRMFKNLYVNIGGVKKDVMEDGWLSCAFYVSSVLYLCKYIKNIHATVSSTVKDLQKCGWKKVKKPVAGSVIVWKPGKDTNGHSHIGFYVGNKQAISNDSWKKHPWKSDWKFNGKREVEMILRKKEIAKS
jgi:hypothetical protein